MLQCTYRSKDQVSRAFGVGATHNGEWYLRGDGERFQWLELILADDARVRYETSWGSSFVNAMFQHRRSASAFYYSHIGWTGLQWALRWYDGSVAIFRACGAAATDVCSIVEMRSPGGLKVQYIRDADTKILRSIRSGAATISLDYDDQHRVIAARSCEGPDVKYEYDEGGRLSRVTESGGIVRAYTYDSRGAMLTIDEPRWHIENAYDADGRSIYQMTRWPDGRTSALRIAYDVRDGSVVKASKSWDNGPKTVYHFNKQHYLESEERDAAGNAPVVINYRRNGFSSISTSLTVPCYDVGPTATQSAGEYDGEAATNALVATTCTD